jgi:methylated-DNA-[protein]-cysteine S-methyltransferase
MRYSQSIDSAAGTLTVRATDKAITSVRFEEIANPNPNQITKVACQQLIEYFEGKRIGFELALSAEGTEFQKSVWQELQRIPAGQTKSYGEIANNIGKPKAARAVGGAVGSNPIAIIIPCHRVLASNGAITGYTGGDGIKTKQKLLDIESLG